MAGIIRTSIMLMLLTAAVSAAAVTIVQDGRSDYQIVVPQDAVPAEVFAAEELASHIEQISGAELRIVRDTEALPKHAILLGNTRYLGELGVSPDWSSLRQEGCLLRSTGDHLIIAAGRPRGTLYGVYSLLEDYWGCRWFAPDTSCVPHKATLSLPDVNATLRPVFEYRDPWIYSGHIWSVWWKDHFSPEYVARTRNSGTRINTSVHPIDEKQGRYFKIPHFGYNFSELVPTEKFAQSHPEYYALYDGRRVTDGELELCLSNPEVARVAAETLAGWMRDDPDADMFFIGQSNTARYCGCEKCESARCGYRGVDSAGRVPVPDSLPVTWINAYGGLAGLNIEFLNRIADIVQAEFPNKRIGTFAHEFTRRPPVGIKAHKNVVVWFCPMEHCSCHPLDRGPINDIFYNYGSELDSWRKVAENVYVYDYWMDGQLGQPVDILTIRDNARFYQRMGVQGVQLDSITDIQAGFGFLRYWLWSEMLRNPDFDFDGGLDEFLAAYYGSAGRYIRQYIEMVSDHSMHESITIDRARMWTVDLYRPLPYGHLSTCRLGSERPLTQKAINRGYELFEKALRSVANEPKALAHVRAARMTLQYAMLEWLPADDRRLKEEAASLLRVAGELEMPSIQSTPVDEYRSRIDKRLATGVQPR